MWHSKRDLKFCQYDVTTERFLVLEDEFVAQILRDTWCDPPEEIKRAIRAAHNPAQTTALLPPLSLKRRILNRIPQAWRTAVKSRLHQAKSLVQRIRRFVLDLFPRHWRLSVKRKLQDARSSLRTRRREADVGVELLPTETHKPFYEMMPHNALISLGVPLKPAPHDILISVGADWHDNLTKNIFDLKENSGCKVMLACYDIIPVIFPQHTVKQGFENIFQVYLVDLAHTADAIFAISTHTQNDLRRFFENQQLGFRLPAIQAIPLAGPVIASQSPSLARSEELELEALRENGNFILYVSTVESRKNHRLLLNLWDDFSATGTKVPTLVFVGMMGWGMGDFVNEAKRSRPYQAGLLQFWNHVSDPQLHYLYRECLFTVFPSLYEGWGLAVTEALAYGKVCIASSNSGTVEAAQGLCPAYHPHDYFGWRHEILRLTNDNEYRHRLEVKIRNEYRSRSWANFASDFASLICELEENG